MKKMLVLATAALLVSSVTFANGDDKKKCAKGKDCCKKEGKACKKDAKTKDAKTAEVKPAAKKA